MRRTIFSLAVSAVFLLSLFSMARFDFAYSSETIVVPTDFPTIQAAINNASVGDTVFVFNGTYLENVVVNKTIMLIGEDRETTIVDGEGNTFALDVASDNVSVGGFTIRNSGPRVVQVLNVDYCNLTGNVVTDGAVGVYLLNAEGSYISSNTVSNNQIGIHFESCDNSTLKNNNVTVNQDAGVHIAYSSNIVASSNFLAGNTNQGLCLNHSSESTVRENLVTDNGSGIHLHYSSDNTIVENNITGSSEGGLALYYSTGNVVNGNNINHNGFGMKLVYSGGNTLRDNHMTSNDYNFEVEAATLSSFVNDIDTSNMVDGRQIYYLVNQKNLVLNSSSNAGYVAVVNSTDISIKDLTLASNGEGLLCAYTDLVKIENCILINNRRGIRQYSSDFAVVRDNLISGNLAEGVSVFEGHKSEVSDNIVTENGVGMFFYYLTNSSVVRNDVTDNFERGIQLLGSTYNVLSQNVIDRNGRQGVYMFNSDNNILSHNQATENLFDGIWLDTSENIILTDNDVSWNDGNGIYMLSGKNCQIQYNRAFGNSVVGIHLSISSNNTLRGNELSGNVDYGVRLYRCSNNTVFHNNFLNHTYHASAFLGSYNSWDDGYPTGGNFWDDYTGEDAYSGPSQDMTGSDGIGDTPVFIASNNIDRYPMMVRISLHDIAILGAAIESDEVYVGWTVDVSVTVENAGDYVETFNVTVYSDDDVIEILNVSNLLIGKSMTLAFSWNTSGLMPCHSYVIRCEADVVPGEIDVEDNVCVVGVVKIKMVGDVDGNGMINIIDIAAIAIAYGSNVGDDDYSLICDLNRDNTINILDLSWAAMSFGVSCVSPP
jgi:parallel beta-helix repeat protein